MICAAELQHPHMQPAGHPGAAGDYYSDHQHQQQQQQQQQQHHQQQQQDRPMLQGYYAHSQPMLQPQFVQQPYYHPAASPTESLHQQQFAFVRPTLFAPQDSLKRAMPTPNAASFSPAAMDAERVCDVCGYPDAVLEAPPCGHAFHSRCAHRWPVEACPACDVPVPQLRVLHIDMNSQIDSRSGKWTRAEEQFIDVILGEFDRNALPLANGTPVRLVLAKLLNCSTMRLSKKFQKNALGKRTFRVEKPTKGEPSINFDRIDHARRQRGFSRAEAVFRHELVEQFRRENNSDEGAHREATDLRRAVQKFWVSNFLKLAVHIGQAVEGMDISDAKKRKHANVLLRNGQYDELLSWHRSPVSASSVGPMPHTMQQGATVMEHGSYMQSLESGHLEEKSSVNTQPSVKKMRTPEGAVDMRRFDNPPTLPTMDPYGYGKLTPVSTSSATSPSSFVAPVGYAQLPHSQQQQQQQPYSYTSSSSGFSSYAGIKEERPIGMGYHQPAVLQLPQSHSQLPVSYDVNDPRSSRPQLAQPDAMYHRNLPAYAQYEQQTGNENLPPTQGRVITATSAAMAAAGGSGQTPWDELLEGMSSNTASGSDQVADPSLQAWSNLHML